MSAISGPLFGSVARPVKSPPRSWLTTHIASAKTNPAAAANGRPFGCSAASPINATAVTSATVLAAKPVPT
jgi:hypothetical protein